MVPEALAGSGRRGAGPRHTRPAAARRAKGLKDARRPRTPHDRITGPTQRSHHHDVGRRARSSRRREGPQDRRASRRAGPRRDKDALDVLRLLRAVPTEPVADRLRISVPRTSPVRSPPRPSPLSPISSGLRHRKAPTWPCARGADEDSATIAASMVRSSRSSWSSYRARWRRRSSYRGFADPSAQIVDQWSSAGRL